MNIQRFTVYRRDMNNRATHNAMQKNPEDAPQYEGVIWTDGTVTLRWLTPLRSHSVWPDIASALGVHGHPEYGTVIEWHDGEPPEAWAEQVRAYESTLIDAELAQQADAGTRAEEVCRWQEDLELAIFRSPHAEDGHWRVLLPETCPDCGKRVEVV